MEIPPLDPALVRTIQAETASMVLRIMEVTQLQIATQANFIHEFVRQAMMDERTKQTEGIKFSEPIQSDQTW